MIGMNLKYLRKKYRYSQEDIAEKLMVSRQSVAKWENGETLPDVFKCAELAKLFEVSVEMLLMCSPGDRLLVLGDKNRGIAIAKINGILPNDIG